MFHSNIAHHHLANHHFNQRVRAEMPVWMRWIPVAQQTKPNSCDVDESFIRISHLIMDIVSNYIMFLFWQTNICPYLYSQTDRYHSYVPNSHQVPEFLNEFDVDAENIQHQIYISFFWMDKTLLLLPFPFQPYFFFYSFLRDARAHACQKFLIKIELIWIFYSFFPFSPLWEKYLPE